MFYLVSISAGWQQVGWIQSLPKGFHTWLALQDSNTRSYISGQTPHPLSHACHSDSIWNVIIRLLQWSLAQVDFYHSSSRIWLNKQYLIALRLQRDTQTLKTNINVQVTTGVYHDVYTGTCIHYKSQLVILVVLMYSRLTYHWYISTFWNWLQYWNSIWKSVYFYI